MIRRSLIAFLALALLAPLALAEGASDGRMLGRLLAAYDRQGGGNTIPIEKEILRLREAGASEALVAHLDHPRFGATVAWALSGIGGEDAARRIVVTARTWPPRQQGMALSTLAALEGDEATALLKEFQADASFPGWAASQLRGALLRRRARDVVKAVRQGLRARETSDVVDAIRAIAESYDPVWLPELSRLARNPRPLAQKTRSQFKVQVPRVSPDGTRFMRWESPELTTVGELALEAASRIVSQDTPPMIAWWYELEKTSRFGVGDEAVGRLRHYVGLDKKAAVLRLGTASDAVDALLRALRRTHPGAESFRLDAIDIVDRTWTLDATIDEDTLEATVSKDGEVDIVRS